MRAISAKASGVIAVRAKTSAATASTCARPASAYAASLGFTLLVIAFSLG
jgi:hypothetical protein